MRQALIRRSRTRTGLWEFFRPTIIIAGRFLAFVGIVRSFTGASDSRWKSLLLL
ncbi:MAG: hypothetical protein M1835_007228 [Candelina submexicana]|nr:MAG: hypothetical protein M1835_007228 [Candelina submexicana]